MPSFRLKRGNSEKVNSYVGNSGELIYNTETQKVVVMDGSTPGGTALGGGGSEIVEESVVTVLKNTGQEVLLGGLIGGSGVITEALAIKVVNDLVVICNSDYNRWTIRNPGDNQAMLIMFSISDFEDWVANGGYVSTRPSFKSWNKSELFTLSGVTHVTEASLTYFPCFTVDPDSTVANPILWCTWDGVTDDGDPANAKFFNQGFKITGANLDNWTPCLHYPTTTPEATGHDVLPVFVDGHEGQAYNIANMNGDHSPADYNPISQNFGGRIYVNSNLIVLRQQDIGIHIYNKSDFSYITSYSPDPAFGLSFFHPDTKSAFVTPGFYSSWRLGCVNVSDDQIIVGYSNEYDYFENWMDYMLPAEVSALGADAIEAWMKINAGRLHVFNATTGAYEYSIENPDRPNLVNGDWCALGEIDSFVKYDETSGYLAVQTYSSAILGGTSYPEMGGIKVFDMNNNGALLYELSPPQDWPPSLTYSWGETLGWFRNSDNNELLLHVSGEDKNFNFNGTTTPLVTSGNEQYTRPIYIYNGTDGSLLKKFNYDDDPDFFLQDPPPFRSRRHSSGFATYDNGKKVIEYLPDQNPNNLIDQAAATSFGYGSKATERKLKLTDNKFIELPLTDTFSLNYATTSQLPTAMSELTNDAGLLTVTETSPVAVAERTMNIKNNIIPLNSAKTKALLGDGYPVAHPIQKNVDGIFYCINDDDIPTAQFTSSNAGTTEPVLWSISQEDATKYFTELGNAAILKSLDSYREWTASDYKTLVDRMAAENLKTFSATDTYYAPVIRVAPNSTYDNPIFIVFVYGLWKLEYDATKRKSDGVAYYSGTSGNVRGCYFKVEGFNPSTAIITEIVMPVKHSEWQVETLAPNSNTPPNYVDAFVGMPIHARAEAYDAHNNTTDDNYDPYWWSGSPMMAVNSNVIAIGMDDFGIHLYNLADCSYIKSWSHPVVGKELIFWGLIDFDGSEADVVASDDYIVMVTGHTNARASKSIDDFNGAGANAPAEDAAFFEDYIHKAALGEIHVFDGTGQNYLYSLVNPAFQEPGTLVSGDWAWNGFGAESNISISGKYLKVGSMAPLKLTQAMADAMAAAGNTYSQSYSEPTVGELLYDEGAICIYDLSIVPTEQYGSFGNNETLLHILQPDTDFADIIGYTFAWDYYGNEIYPYGDNDAIILIHPYNTTWTSYGVKGFLASTGEQLFHLPNLLVNGKAGETWLSNVHYYPDPNTNSNYGRTERFKLCYLSSGAIFALTHVTNSTTGPNTWLPGFAGFGARFVVEGEKRIQIGENQFMNLPINSSTSIAKNRTGSADIMKAISALEARIYVLENQP